MKIRVVVPVSTEPLTLDEVKAHLRLDVCEPTEAPEEPTEGTTEETTEEPTAEEVYLSALITAAREYCENVTGRALATQTIEGYLDRYPAKIELPRPPLQSVTSVKHTDSAGAEVVLVENVDYLVDTDRPIGRLMPPYGKGWPQFTPSPMNPVKIKYVAGYETAPASIKHAMLLLVGHWYENREAVMETQRVMGPIAFAVNALLAPYKVRWF
jgi:uncharacterized phiE125 gp8 family phage protein